MMNEKPIYIFISHSHKDIEKVRLVRNYLESLSRCEPLLFFLLSVTDDNLITELIENEIDARIWFVLCQSQNARKSNWVKSEVDYARKIGKHNFIEIDLDKSVENGELTKECQDYISNAYRKFNELSNIFISYSRKDEIIVKEIVSNLAKYNISLKYLNDSFSYQNPGEDFFSSISLKIENSQFFLMFYSEPNSYIEKEFELALRLQKKIVIVFLDSGQPRVGNQFMQYLQFDFDTRNIKASSDKLIKYLFDQSR